MCKEVFTQKEGEKHTGRYEHRETDCMYDLPFLLSDRETSLQACRRTDRQLGGLRERHRLPLGWVNGGRDCGWSVTAAAAAGCTSDWRQGDSESKQTNRAKGLDGSFVY
mmetsp:Transcript_49790/g.98123  ORF Transcript_49790/g.98123 Transcript_49790/m.98123 type:complete len:109 (+) Transcript_49790:752-1078(+)